MQNIMIFMWFICAFIIVWAMIGYPLFLKMIDKFIKAPSIKKDYEYPK